MEVAVRSDRDGALNGITGVIRIVIGRDGVGGISKKNVQGDGVADIDGGHFGINRVEIILVDASLSRMQRLSCQDECFLSG